MRPTEHFRLLKYYLKKGDRKVNEKLLSLLGIARRAGRLSMGFDAAAEAAKKGSSRLPEVLVNNVYFERERDD